MIEPARAVKAARQAAGLSQRALAATGGVSWTTVARIERGTVDPTVGMLNRLLAAAGADASLSLAPSGNPRSWPTIAALADAWTTGVDGQALPDWTRLRRLTDHLALHPADTYAATLTMPPSSGSQAMDAILASLAEKACDDARIPRPTWTRRVPAVDGGWSMPGTPAMRETARQSTPRQFAARGLVMVGESLWRR